MKNLPVRVTLNKPQVIRLVSVFAVAAAIGAAVVFAIDQWRKQ